MNSSSFLKISETYAIRRLLGNIPSSKERLKLCLGRQKEFSELWFKIDDEILANTGLLLSFKTLKTSCNSISFRIFSF